MNSINSLEKEKKEHAEIFYGLLEFEEIIDSNNPDYWNLIYTFHKILNLISQHEKYEEYLLNKINNNENGVNISKNMILIDQRAIRGHIKVIGEAIKSKDMNYIRVALDNDGRMFVSRVKEQIFKEEQIFDNLLFLHLVH